MSYAAFMSDPTSRTMSALEHMSDFHPPVTFKIIREGDGLTPMQRAILNGRRWRKSKRRPA